MHLPYTTAQDADEQQLLKKAQSASALPGRKRKTKADAMEKQAGAKVNSRGLGPSAHAEQDGEARMVHGTLGPMRITYGTQQSYIRVLDLSTNKWPLFVVVSAKMTADHQKICKRLFKASMDQRLNKAQALELRQSLI